MHCCCRRNDPGEMCHYPGVQQLPTCLHSELSSLQALKKRSLNWIMSLFFSPSHREYFCNTKDFVQYTHSFVNVASTVDWTLLVWRETSRQTHNLTSDGPVECKGQGPRGIIAVLCITICFISVQIEWGRVSVSCVSILILRAILG